MRVVPEIMRITKQRSFHIIRPPIEKGIPKACNSRNPSQDKKKFLDAQKASLTLTPKTSTSKKLFINLPKQKDIYVANKKQKTFSSTPSHDKFSQIDDFPDRIMTPKSSFGTAFKAHRPLKASQFMPKENDDPSEDQIKCFSQVAGNLSKRTRVSLDKDACGFSLEPMEKKNSFQEKGAVISIGRRKIFK